MSEVWIVEIDESDWDYDRFESAAVWADSAEEAETVVRAALRYPEEQDTPRSLRGELWIEDPEWKLNVRRAPTEGIIHTHWHAG